jgi:AcrR family transcriptional regulator
MGNEVKVDDGLEGGRQRRVKREEVRRRLLSTAYGLFTELGYEGASLERVALAAGFSKGAVYSNFANKDELFFELVATRIDERIEAVKAAGIWRDGESEGRAIDATARIAGTLIRALGEADPGWQMLFIEFWLRCARNGELRTRLAERRVAMRSKIAESIAAQASTSGISLLPGEAMDLATTVLALSNGLGIEGLIDPAAVRPELLGEILAKVVAPASGRGSDGGSRT